MTTALLLIDDPNMRNMLREIMVTQWEYDDVIIAEDVDSCLTLALDHHPDVIVSDNDAPHGIADESLVKIPVIFITDKPPQDMTDPVDPRFSGIIYDDICTPLDVEELQLRVRNITVKAKRFDDSG